MPQEQWQVAWKDYYAILQVQPTAEAAVIKLMARSLAQRYHPDKPGGDVKRMALINEAGEYLGDEQKKAVYDIEWRARQKQSEPHTTPPLPPKPHVNPSSITIARTSDTDVYTARFTLANSGGPHTDVRIVTPRDDVHPNHDARHWLGEAAIEFQSRSRTLPAVVTCPVSTTALDPRVEHRALVFVVLTDAEDEAYTEAVGIVIQRVPAPPAGAGQAPLLFRDKFCKRCGRPFRAQEKWCPNDRYQRR